MPWSCYVRLLSVRDAEAQRFCEAEALRGGWTVRQLDRQVGSQFYERTALSKNKVAMLRKGQQQTRGDRDDARGGSVAPKRQPRAPKRKRT